MNVRATLQTLTITLAAIIASMIAFGAFILVVELSRTMFKENELQLLFSVDDADDIPDNVRYRIIVADVNNVLQFRIFDLVGKQVVDANEKSFPEQTRQIEDLRKRLQSLAPPPEAGRN